MLRALVLLLVAANLLFFAWSQSWLEGFGLRPHADREPDRLKRQVRPEAVVILPPPAASAASAGAGTSSTSAAPVAVPASAATPVAAAASTAGVECVEAGPFGAGAAVSAAAWVRNAGAPDGWREVAIETPTRWLVYMGRYADPSAAARKEEELRRTRLNFELVREPAELAPGFSLGRYDSRAAAEKALEQFSQRGVRSARVVEQPGRAQHFLRAASAPRALAEKLLALRGEAIGRGFAPCGTVAAAAAAATAAPN